MNSENERDLLRQAAEALQIKDVVLHGSTFEQQNPLPNEEAEVIQQQMEGWRYRRGEADGRQWLQVLYRFGARLAEPGEDEESVGEIYYTIEAEFMAHYHFEDGELSEEAIKVFAKYNTRHNVWPFWREFVFATCQRARLNPPEIGLYSGPCE
mgnify:CR=1 FL=1